MATLNYGSGLRCEKVIIAGGRDYTDKHTLFAFLDKLVAQEKIAPRAVISGCARGADTLGEQWAKARGIDVIRCPAEWDRHGKEAGFIRNQKMADMADSLVLFPGGRGSADMKRRARKKYLRIWEYGRSAVR